MAYKDKLTILIRITGIYFIWQIVQAVISFISITLFSPISRDPGLLEIFSWNSMGPLFLFQTIVMTSILNGIIGYLCLGKTTLLVNWLMKGIPSTKTPNTSLMPIESLALTLQIVSIILIGFTLKSLGSAFPTLMFRTENPLTDPALIVYSMQLLIGLTLVFRALSIARWIQKNTK